MGLVSRQTKRPSSGVALRSRARMPLVAMPIKRNEPEKLNELLALFDKPTLVPGYQRRLVNLTKRYREEVEWVYHEIHIQDHQDVQPLIDQMHLWWQEAKATHLEEDEEGRLRYRANAREAFRSVVFAADHRDIYGAKARVWAKYSEQMRGLSLIDRSYFDRRNYSRLKGAKLTVLKANSVQREQEDILVPNADLIAVLRDLIEADPDDFRNKYRVTKQPKRFTERMLEVLLEDPRIYKAYRSTGRAHNHSPAEHTMLDRVKRSTIRRRLLESTFVAPDEYPELFFVR